jgi:hypothetical protein
MKNGGLSSVMEFPTFSQIGLDGPWIGPAVTGKAIIQRLGDGGFIVDLAPQSSPYFTAVTPDLVNGNDDEGIPGQSIGHGGQLSTGDLFRQHGRLTEGSLRKEPRINLGGSGTYL